jgi:type IX secretion system PorP/SprF family membrane protein
LLAQDNLAVLHRTTLSAAYAYRIVARRVSFSAGISPGVELYRNDWSQVQTTSAGDAAFGYTEQFTQLSIGYGLYLNAQHFFIGISSRIAGRETVTNKQQPYMLYSGVRFGKPEKVQLTVSNLTRIVPGSNLQTDVNVFCMFRKRIGAGVGYRYNDAMMGMLQVQLNDQFSLSYAYDYSISELRNYSSGSHEILLRYDFGYTLHRTSPR